MVINLKTKLKNIKNNNIFRKLPKSKVVGAWIFKNRSHQFLSVMLILLLLLPIAGIITSFLSSPVEAAWFDYGFSFRKKIPVTNSSGSTQTDFQLQTTLDTATLITAGKLQSDCDDMRFTNISGKVLAYWLEPNTCNTNTTLVWFKADSIPTTGADIYFYYGNPTTAGASSTEKTFIRDINGGAAVSWPLDETVATQSYARDVNPALATGRNIVINGGFDADASWAKGTGWTITAGGVAHQDGTGNSTGIQQTILTGGKVYTVTYTIVNVTGTGFRPYLGGTIGTTQSTAGTYTETLVAGSTNTIFQIYTNGSGVVGDIDNVIVTQLNIPASNPVQLLGDSSMEASGTTSWTAGNSATLSKQTGTRTGGSGTSVLRVARNSVNAPYASQNVVTVGQTYQITGYTRSDGNASNTPLIQNGSTTLYTGTATTNWQPFAITFVAATTDIRLGTPTTTGSQYVEYDDVTVNPVTNLLADGNMEDNDGSPTSSWTAINSATLSKQTGTPHGGAQVLRVTPHASFGSPRAEQDMLTAGITYRVTGYMRGNGTVAPTIRNAITSGGTTAVLATGTTSTTWQPFDVVFVSNGVGIQLANFDATAGSGNYTEFDDVVVSLDSSYGIRQGELLQDNDMEDTAGSGVNYWTALASATLTKEVGAPHGGARSLRVAYNGTGNPSAAQIIMVVGKRYRVTGWYHGDGSNTAQIRDTNTQIGAASTSSTSWQFFDTTFVAASTSFRLVAIAAGAGYAEFDDFSLTEVSPLVGIPTNGVTLGTTAGVTHLSRAYTFDGSNDFVNIYSSDLNSVFNQNEGTLVAWAKYTGAWNDSTIRYIFRMGFNSNSEITLRKTTTTNQLLGSYVANGTTKQVSDTSLAGTANWFQVVISWSKSADQFKMYLNGAQVGSTQTGLGTWNVNLDSAIATIGIPSGVSNPWTGMINDVRLYTRALTPEEIAAQYNASYDVQAYTTGNYQGHELLRKYNTSVTLGSFATEETGPGASLSWNFTDGQGQTVQDGTSNNNDGVLGANATPTTDDPTWQAEDACVAGKCLQFDGSNDIVTGSAISRNLQTVSFWIRPNTITTQGIFNLDGGTHKISTDGSGNITAGGWSSPVYYINGRLTTTPTLTLNTWQYVTVTTATPFDTTSSFTIGKDGTNFIKGYIDEVKFYPYARSLAQVQVDYNLGAEQLGKKNQQNFLSNGLVGYWKLDEAPSTWNNTTSEVVDSSGNGNHGKANSYNGTSTGSNSSTTLNDTGKTWTVNVFTNDLVVISGGLGSGQTRTVASNTATALTVTTAWTTTPDATSTYRIYPSTTTGKFGNAAGLYSGNGQNQNILITSSSTLQTGNIDFTVSTWVKLNTGITGAENPIVTKFQSNDGSAEYELYYDATAQRFKFRWVVATTINEAIANTFGAPTLGTWYLVTAYHDANKGLAGISINAGPADTIAAVGGNAAGTDVNIGSRGGATITNATIDEVRMYKRLLSPAETTDLYNWAPGPIGYWKMDEGSGTSTVDSSGNANNSSSMTANIWAQGKYGKGIITRNDAVSDKVTITDPASAILDFSNTDNFSFGLWVKTPGTGASTPYPFLKGGSNPSTAGYNLQISSGAGNFVGCQYSDGDGSGYESAAFNPTAFFDNQWHYVTCVMDRNAAAYKLYVDGVLRASDLSLTEGSAKSSTQNLTFGEGSAVNYDGAIDDVKIYNYARTAGQIIEDMNADHPIGGSPVGSPLVYWALDEQNGTGANSVHNTGNGGSTYNGNNTGATWRTKTDCKINGCLEVDTSTDTMDAGDVAFVDGLTQMTVSMWINPTSLQANASILEKWTTGNAQTNFLIRAHGTNTDELYFFIANSTTDGGTNYFLTSNLDLATSTWTHLTFVYDGTAAAADRAKVYKNGLPVSGSISGTIPTAMSSGTTSTLVLGDSDVVANTELAKYDEVKIYTTALTPEQVKLDMNSGSSQSYSVLGASEDSLLTDTAGNPPVYYWNFDEKQDNTCTSGVNDVCDKGSNTKDGAWNGTLGNQWTTGKFGSAGNFNGSNNYVDVGSTPAALTDSNTISFWLYPNNTSAGNIIDRPAWCGTGGWRVIRNSDTNFSYTMQPNGGSATLLTLSSSTPANQWAFVSVVKNGSTVYTYTNGILSDTDTGAPTMGDTTLSIAIGQDNAGCGGAGWYNGKIDDVKIYNYARTQAQVAYDYNRGGPVGYWQFDECQGLTAYDASGFGNNGTITLGASPAAGTCNTASTAWGGTAGTGPNGKYNGALTFDGTDDYVDIYSSGLNSVFNGSEGTVSAWAKFTGAWNDGAARGIFDIKADVSNYVLIDKNTTTNDIVLEYAAGGTFKNIHITTSTTDWFQVVMTWSKSANQVKIYFNGLQSGATLTSLGTWTGSLSSTGTVIGALTTTSNRWTGQVDDVRLYNYALSLNQVKQLYNQGAGVRFGPATGSP